MCKHEKLIGKADGIHCAICGVLINGSETKPKVEKSEIAPVQPENEDKPKRGRKKKEETDNG